MELSDLLIFKTVAVEGGISRAAQKLHRVPSNITARVQKLEQELGKELFVREKNRLSTSAAGVQLLQYAERILNLADEAINELNGQEPKGQLNIGAMEAAATTHLAPILKQYHLTYPQIDLKMQTAPTGNLISMVLRGDLDVAFVADPPADERLNQQKTFQEKLVLVTSLDYPRITQPKQLKADKPLLGFNPSCTYRKRLEAWVGSGDRAFNVVEISSYATLLGCASAGMGVGIVPESLIALYPFPDTLKTHTLPKKWSQSNTFLIWKKGFDSPNIRSFAETVKAL